MITKIESILKEVTGADSVEEADALQTLWSGYGSIIRYALKGADRPSVIVKHVCPPQGVEHPRGWNTGRSHQRKVRSYEVETNWYRSYANRCPAGAVVPRCLGVDCEGDERVIVLEDLDANGYFRRCQEVSETELRACLSWLAHFHAAFLGEAADGLWEQGTYWHLATRPDELKVLAEEDPDLFAAAEAIDAKLNHCRYMSLVHGDAKLANFCFSADGREVAAVDFQYVGGGCGMKDLAYFIGSCLDEQTCERRESELLDFYFASLREALAGEGRSVDMDALETEWRVLYPVAWADFHRFLKGWSSGHWKIHSYSERLTRAVVASIKEGQTCN